jgi:4'-phosphopantetheinyl transferase
LREGEVHLWRAHLDLPDDASVFLRDLLSADESRRARRLRPEVRERFVARRAFLRLVLAGYLSLRPEEVRITQSGFGKPAVLGGRYDIRFNLSHSGAMALYAFTLGREVGIDVERIRRHENMKGIIERFFSREEREAFAGAAEGEKLTVFYDLWVRKEAHAKAHGMGLLMPFDDLRVSRSAGVPAEVHPGVRRCSLFSFVPEDGHTAAVAVEGDDPVFSFWECSGPKMR